MGEVQLSSRTGGAQCRCFFSPVHVHIKKLFSPCPFYVIPLPFFSPSPEVSRLQEIILHLLMDVCICQTSPVGGRVGCEPRNVRSSVSVTPLCWSRLPIFFVLFLCRLPPQLFCPSNFSAFTSFHLSKCLPLSVSARSLFLCLSVCVTLFLPVFSLSPPVPFLYCSLCPCLCLSSQTSVFVSHDLLLKYPVTFMSHKHPFMKNLKRTRNASLTAHPGPRCRKLQLLSMLTAYLSAVRSRKRKHSLSFSKCA